MSHAALKKPNFLKACTEYSEQEGWNLHALKLFILNRLETIRIKTVIASEAKQSDRLDCFVAEFTPSNVEGLLAMTFT